MDRGGAETFLMKVYRSLDKSKYQMDFCVSNPKKGFYDDEIKLMGGRIYLTHLKSKNPIKSFMNVKRIVKDGQYECVLRTSQQSLATIDLIAAKLGGAKKLIFRSSNANIIGGKKSKLINSLFSFLPKVVPNVKIAPSTEAAEFVFGKNAVKNNNVTILPNGLDYDMFKFDIEKRNKIRKELCFENNTVYGHIGRFNEQKNHNFLLDIFKEIYKKDSQARLILIGEGELFESIKSRVESLGLNEVVKFLGPQANVNEYLFAMDLFIFPSLFEGMPNVIIEAQAAGLKCVLSNSITKEAAITDLLSYMDLNLGAEKWAQKCVESINYERKSYENEFENEGYIIYKSINKYIDILF